MCKHEEKNWKASKGGRIISKVDANPDLKVSRGKQFGQSVAKYWAESWDSWVEQAMVHLFNVYARSDRWISWDKPWGT